MENETMSKRQRQRQRQRQSKVEVITINDNEDNDDDEAKNDGQNSKDDLPPQQQPHTSSTARNVNPVLPTVTKLMADSADWRTKGVVTPPNDTHSTPQQQQLNSIAASPVTFICEIGQKLKLSTMVIATAVTLFHRFQLSPSKNQIDLPMICLTILYIAAKTEETPRDLRDVITTGYTALHSDDKLLCINVLYRDLRESVICCEQIVYRALRFDFAVEHPHRYLILLLQSIETDKKTLLLENADADIMSKLAKRSWAVLCDSYRISMCIDEAPLNIAATCVYVAAKMLDLHTSLNILAYLHFFLGINQSPPPPPPPPQRDQRQEGLTHPTRLKTQPQQPQTNTIETLAIRIENIYGPKI